MLTGKLKYLLVAILVSWISLEGTAQSQLTFPSVLPPSPNSAELGKYGDIPINLSTGALNLSIPVLEYSTKNLKLPVAVSYSSNGLRVNAIASQAGFDWALSAGGVITRTIFDAPDLFTGQTRMPLVDLYNQNNTLLNYLEQSISNGGDTEPDVFNFTFNGIAGKFIIGNDGLPIVIPHSNLKIEYSYVGTGLIFQITTPDGVKYFFGGTNATEYSKTSSSADCGGAQHISGADEFVPNSWYLTKIEHPLGDFINLTYEQTSYTYRSGVEQTLTRPVGTTITQECVYDDGIPGGSIHVTRCPQYPDLTCYSRLEVEGVILKEITSSSFGRVVFDYQTRLDIGDKLVSAITLFNDENSQIRKIVFHHQMVEAAVNTAGFTDPGDNFRPFLMKISEYGQSNTLPREYSFFYNDLNQLPGRLTFAQDYQGYYNGKSNTYLAPAPQSYQDKILFNNNGGNREADPIAASKGILYKVVYPTGGANEIYYEANDAYITEDLVAIHSATVHSDGNTAAYYNGDHIINSENFSISIEQYITVNGTLSNANGITDADNHIKARITITNSNTGVVVFDDYVNQNQTRHFDNIYLQAGNYTLTIDLFGYDGFHANASLQHYSQQTVTHNKTLPGLRVHKIISVAGSNIETKKYNYRYISDLNKSSGKIKIPNHLFVSSMHTAFPCTERPDASAYLKYCDYKVLHSNSLTASKSLASNNVFYESVLVSNGENFAKGGTENIYKVSIDGPAYQLMGEYIPEAPLSNFGYDNGLPLKENIFKWVNNSPVYLRKSENFYKEDPAISKQVVGVYTKKNFNAIFTHNPPVSSDFAPFDVAIYYLNCKWKYIYKTEITEFSSDGAGSIVNSMEYFYENPTHALLNRTITRDSKNTAITEHTKYPQDISASGSEETARLGLINTYQIGTPIEQSREHNGATIKKHYKYKQWSSGKYLPEVLDMNTGLNRTMESRFEYVAYGNSGNILERRSSKNTSEAYIWGYKDFYPVAHVINARYSEIYFADFEKNGWDAVNPIASTLSAYDNLKAHTGRYSGRIDNVGPGKKSVHADKWLTVSLAEEKKFKFSGWYYSSGPGVEIVLFMKTATEQGSYTHVASVAGTKINKWTYLEGEYTVPADITQLNLRIDNNGAGTVWFDDLRLLPSRAVMTTYTYDPLIGMTSETNPNGRVTYYAYDSFGRLSIVRDHDGNVLKKLCYNYAGQAENCQ